MIMPLSDRDLRPRGQSNATLVLALDLGTSGCKGALYTEGGQRVALASAEYAVVRPHPNWAEQAPADYLETARRVCRELQFEGASIAALGFSTQTPTLVFCDDQGTAVAPAIVWQDTRAEDEAAWLEAHTSQSTRREWFGADLPLGAASTSPKLLWMARHSAPQWTRTRWVVQPKDYVAFHLTGEIAADAWCAKGIAHLDTGAMHPAWMDLLAKNASISPRLLKPEAISGRVVREDWGIPAGTPVITGWSDALAGILATGALHRQGHGFVLAGTSEIVGMSRTESPQADGLFRVPGDLIDLEGLELHFGPTQAGGASLEWAARLFGRTPGQLLESLPGCGLSEIVFRPYLYGERAPYWNHSLTATFEGLNAGHGMAEMTHAILQGVALQEKLVLARAERGQPVDEVMLAGGAARDPRWNQLRANVLQRRCVVMDDIEASLRGVAVLAWAAVKPGFLKRPPEGWFSGEELLPEPQWGPVSERLMERFRL